MIKPGGLEHRKARDRLQNFAAPVFTCTTSTLPPHTHTHTYPPSLTSCQVPDPSLLFFISEDRAFSVTGAPPQNIVPADICTA